MSEDPVLDPPVPPPESDAMPIWRYMDVPKFVAILENRTLFFTRVAVLEDRFEGSFPPSQPPLSRILEMLPPGAVPPNALIKTSPGLDRVWSFLREWVTVNCWHASPYESAAMWRLYSESNAAVAIRTTVGRLRAALGDRPPFQAGFGGADQYHIGMVKYIDFEKDRIPVGSFASQFFRKRKSFEHERELRVLLIDFPITMDNHIDYTRLPDYPGREVRIDPGALIEGIITGPDAPHWYLSLVAKLLARYGIAATVAESKLATPPHY